ncbi:uncharacterized protein LOC132951568 [Metopolophium dirhodum]|uniref:uncharacterized protein LOC132951568 n=1 Tax=Metopolophium dirhodum TaxID=44670 RepID=UPI0029900AA1|nr:uncharacterized protein LOC132951568 [Metopolophium dirhodum]
MDILRTEDDERTFSADCRTRTPGGHRATPTRGVLARPRRGALQQAAEPSRQFSGVEDALVLDGDFYGMQRRQQRRQQPARDRAEDESGNQPLPEDHHHGNAARVRETGPGVRSGVRQAVGRAVWTRKVPAADRGAARACRTRRW